MSEVKIRLPAPHPVQKKILSRPTRFNAICMGEKGGKTTLGIEVLIMSARGALAGNAPVAWFAATKEELVEVKRIVRRAIDQVIKRQPNARRIELANGNAIDFYSLDEMPKSFPQYGLIVVDDVCQVPLFLDTWEDVLSECLREHQGEGWFLSNAYGKRNDFYRLYQIGNLDPDWSCWQFPSDCNPFLPEDAKAEMAEVTELELRQRFGAEFLDVAVELTAAQRVLKQGETFIQWCERLEQDGLKVDGVPFTLSDRPAMRFIYELIPSTREEAFERVDVIMKCTQVGFTVMEMLAAIYLALRFAPAKIGMFMPSTSLASGKSSERFLPIARTVPAVHRLMTEKNASGGRGGEGNVLIRNLGPSRFHFLWTSGATATESFPMDVISFDEVQEMLIADMEKVVERLSASKLKYTLMGSTANWPDSDIHWWYQRGTQHQFHTECPHCGLGQVLDEHFPECIQFDPQHPKRKQRGDTILLGEYRYQCHSCKGWIDDPQQGEWIAKNPAADIRSVHFPQFLSPTISPRNIIEAFRNNDSMKGFYNRKLGKPYTDPSQVPVNLEMLNQCAAEGMRRGVVWKDRARNTFMGIDQMGAYNVAIIKERMDSGHQAVIHLEYIFDADPFMRCSKLMELYGVQCCVVETLPNYNDAKRFAQRHSGKVFLAGYGNMDNEMLIWGDTPKSNSSDRRTDEEALDRYTVRLDQYKCMQVSMARFATQSCLFPDPTALVQMYAEKGEKALTPVCKDVAFFHFTRTALVVEKDEDEKKYKRKVVKVGIDPHTSYANMLCDVAWSRAHGTSTFILPSGGTDHQKALEPGQIDIPDQIAAVMSQLQISRDEVCGNCVNRDEETGLCSEQRVLTAKADPGCWAFIAKG
ncbi:hypothetical protein FHR70_000731 [Microvirga lupini]|uniref:Phage terminase large subunit GpA ATPase domain-containing protein n=1 Tax=Microvirga lupini TaxID=420324 RepID=A0A7W4YVA8_9HYPH|nr:phage terminase large subunit family protein [Microvirga lupini]MBB3017691.1 hypothetical protein [Microvirga lupini]